MCHTAAPMCPSGCTKHSPTPGLSIFRAASAASSKRSSQFHPAHRAVLQSSVAERVRQPLRSASFHNFHRAGSAANSLNLLNLAHIVKRQKLSFPFSPSAPPPLAGGALQRKTCIRPRQPPLENRDARISSGVHSINRGGVRVNGYAHAASQPRKIRARGRPGTFASRPAPSRRRGPRKSWGRGRGGRGDRSPR